MTDDRRTARAAADEVFARYNGLENYRRVFEREGVASVAELAVVGSESEVEEQLQRFADAGVTDLWPAPYPVGDDRRREPAPHPRPAGWPGPVSGRYAQELIDGGFAVEVADAPLLHGGLNIADLAHVLVLRERGVVPERGRPAAARVLLDAVDTPVAEFGYDPVHGEVYNCRERRFAARIGHDAGWLHAGRPRREAVRIALRLRVRRDVADLIEAAAGSPPRSPRMAEAHAETVMAEQTYLQHAQPSTFGHYLLGAVYPVLRDGDRLTADLDWVNRSPAGAGGVNGSPLTGDRQRMADLLGFDGVIEHTRDAMWQADGFTSRGRDAAEPGHHAGQAGRGPGDLGQRRVRLRQPRRRAHPVQRADAAEAQPVRADDGPRRGRGPDRTGHRDAGAGQEPVGAQRQPDLRLRRGAAGA